MSYEQYAAGKSELPGTAPVMNEAGPGFPMPTPAQPGFNPQMPPPYEGYPPSNPGYPPPQNPGYPPKDPGYPPAQMPGFAPPGNPGYPPPGGYSAPNPPSYQGQPGYPPAPITQPPAGGGPPAGMQPNTSIPPGLEYLTCVDQLIIKQKFEPIESILGFEMNNKYSVKNALGQTVYKAKEKTNCCTRNICGSIRSFHMKIKDLHENEVIHLQRPLRCTSCFCPCFLQKIQVEAPRDNVIGYVYQEWSILFPKFTVRDELDNIIFRIEGPLCTSSFCGDVEFEVISEQTGQNVGRISKQWSGLLREAFTDADNFGISFPLDLSVKVKATLMAAAFLIDFMFFEKSGNHESDRIGMLD